MVTEAVADLVEVTVAVEDLAEVTLDDGRPDTDVGTEEDRTAIPRTIASTITRTRTCTRLIARVRANGRLTSAYFIKDAGIVLPTQDFDYISLEGMALYQRTVGNKNEGI